MEVSPLLANDTKTTIDAALRIHKQADRPNLYVKIPGTPAGVPAIEAAIFAGVPVNVTLLFSREHYLSVAEAYLRGIERRIAAGLDPRINSVASLFVSRWDRAVGDKVPEELRNRLGIAVAARTYRAHNELLASKRWRDLEAAGARKQRMLWASTGTKDPKASARRLYVEALAAPDTIDTMPEKTLLAFAVSGSGQVRHGEGRRRCRTGAGWFCRRRYRRSTRSRRNCKSRGRRRSSSRGTNSCSASQRRARHWRRLESEDQSPRRLPCAGLPRWWIFRGSSPPITASGRTPALRPATSRLRHPPDTAAAPSSTRASMNGMCSRSVRPSASTASATRHPRTALHRLRHSRALGARLLPAPSKCLARTASMS